MAWFVKLWRFVTALVLNSVLVSMFSLALIAIFLVVFLLDDYIGIDLILSGKQIADWAAAGDFIGGLLNPLISFIALTALLFTIRQNNIALEATQDELTASREEMNRSATALEEQLKQSRKSELKHDYYTAIDSSYIALERSLNIERDIGMYVNKTLYLCLMRGI